MVRNLTFLLAASVAFAQISPDSLMMQNGAPVRTANAWTDQRRPELMALFESQVYGKTPADKLPIHTGPAVVGEMGYGKTRYLTAVGDTVHVASRLEALTKDYECELVVSEQVMARAGLSAPEWPRHDLTVRNREAPLRIVVVKDARYLADRILAGDGAERQPT